MLPRHASRARLLPSPRRKTLFACFIGITIAGVCLLMMYSAVTVPLTPGPVASANSRARAGQHKAFIGVPAPSTPPAFAAPVPQATRERDTFTGHMHEAVPQPATVRQLDEQRAATGAAGTATISGGVGTGDSGEAASPVQVQQAAADPSDIAEMNASRKAQGIPHADSHPAPVPGAMAAGGVPSPFAGEVALGMQEWPLVNELSAGLKRGRMHALHQWALTGSAVPTTPRRDEEGDVEGASAEAGTTVSDLISTYNSDTSSESRWAAVAKHVQPTRVDTYARAVAALRSEGADQATVEALSPSHVPLRAQDIHKLVDGTKLAVQIGNSSVLAIETGVGHLGFRAASDLEANSVVSVVWDADQENSAADAANRVAMREAGGVGNLVVCRGTLTKHDLDNLRRSGTRFGLTLVGSLESLVNGRLPHEFEEWFGALLSLSEFTALPASLPNTRYFSYWPSAMALVSAAAADAGIAARFRDSAAVGASNNAPRWNQPQQSPRGVEAGMLVVGVRSPEAEDILQDLRRRVLAAEEVVKKRRHEREAAAAEAAESGFKVDEGDVPSEDDETAEYLVRHGLTLATLGDMDAAPAAGTPLSALLALGVVPAERRRLFRTMLKADLPPYAAPGTVVFEAGAISYRGPVPAPPTPVDDSEAEAAPPAASSEAEAASAPSVVQAVLERMSTDAAAPPTKSPSQPADAATATAPTAPVDPPTRFVADTDDGSQGEEEEEDPLRHKADNWDSVMKTHKSALDAVRDEDAARKRVVDEHWSAPDSGAAATPAPTDAPVDAPAAAATPEPSPAPAPSADAGSDGEWPDIDVNQLMAEMKKANLRGAKAAAGDDASPSSRRLLGLLMSDDGLARQASLAAVRSTNEAAAAKLRRAVARRRHGTRESNWAQAEGAAQDWLVAAERGCFSAWWPVLKQEMAASKLGGDSWTAITYGTGLGLVSAKIARAFPESTLVAVKRERADVEPHQALLELLGVRNCLLASSRLSRHQLKALASVNDPARFQVLGVDVFEELLANADSLWRFEEFFGALLGLASTTFLEVPSWGSLAQALQLLYATGGGASATTADATARGNSAEPSAGADEDDVPLDQLAESPQLAAWSKPSGAVDDDEPLPPPQDSAADDALDAIATRYPGTGLKPIAALLSKAAKAAGRAGFSVRLLVPPKGAACRTSVLRIDAAPWARRGATVAPKAGQLPRPGVSLHTLLTLGVVESVRADLFRLFLYLPSLPAAEATLAPWDVRYHRDESLAEKGLPESWLAITVPVDGIATVITSSDRVAAAAHDAVGDQLSPGPVAAAVDPRWPLLNGELSPDDTSCGGGPGKFSFIEYNSGAGVLSMNVARQFPQATVISIEESSALSDAHLASALRHNVSNNAVCRKVVDDSLLRKFWESPEFVRFQVLSGGVVDLIREHGVKSLQRMVGKMLGVGMTTFLELPSARLLSLAFTTFFAAYPNPSLVPDVDANGVVPDPEFPSPKAATMFRMQFHPRPAFEASHVRLLAALGSAPGETGVAVTVVGGIAGVDQKFVRLDITHLVRNVNHHFESNIDGHDRKYQLQVNVNETATELHRLHSHARLAVAPDRFHMEKGNHPNHGRVVSVHLIRQFDKSDIPYVTVHGVTLITMLRLGLLSPLVTRAYHQFVALPLYEDMAPWNIVFLGPTLDYIDYDTKDHTYDDVVPKAYQIMEVLFNYKRTVQDFQKCGPKSSNPYNFPYVSECVGSYFRGPCKDPAFPVPCGDGSCQSDYVACLRAVSKQELGRSRRGPKRPTPLRDVLAPAALGLGPGGAGGDAAAAQQQKPKHLRSGEWRFDNSGLVDEEKDEAGEDGSAGAAAQQPAWW